MRILFVEDDAIIASGLIYALKAEGWDVTHQVSAAGAAEEIARRKPDLALLDLSLPDGTGYDIFQSLRRVSDVPAIFLTAADDEGNTVKALELGADDYITKPFRVRELLARIKTVLRRAGESGSDLLTLGDIKIDAARARVTRGADELTLTALEYRLLLVLAQNKGRVFGRAQILSELWDVAGNFVNDNTLTVYIKRLREKLEHDPQNPILIQTVRGLGYKASEL